MTEPIAQAFMLALVAMLVFVLGTLVERHGWNRRYWFNLVVVVWITGLATGWWDETGGYIAGGVLAMIGLPVVIVDAIATGRDLRRIREELGRDDGLS